MFVEIRSSSLVKSKFYSPFDTHIMEINGYCVENTHFCLWSEDEEIFVEDMRCSAVLLLNFQSLVWFEAQMIDMVQLSKQMAFSNQIRNESGTFKIQKYFYDLKPYVEFNRLASCWRKEMDLNRCESLKKRMVKFLGHAKCWFFMDDWSFKDAGSFNGEERCIFSSFPCRGFGRQKEENF